MGVAGHVDVDLGEDLVGGAGQRRGVDLRAAGHEDLRVTGEGVGVIECGGDCHAGVVPVRVPGQHDRATTRQRSPDGFVRHPPHDEGVAQGDGLEVAEVLTAVPRDVGAVADDSASRVGSDQRDASGMLVHTAIGALIAGYGS